MKKIVILLLVSAFLLSGSGTLAKNIDIQQQSYQSISLDDNVPVWNISDQWTYTVHNFSVHYNQGGQLIYMNGKISDFTWEVTDTAGDFYTVAVTGKVSATYNITLSAQTSTLHLTGSFKPTLTRFKGTIQLTKSDLEIHDLSIQLRGISKMKINSIPFGILFPFKLTTEGDLSDDFPLFDFPLYEFKFWNLPDLTITMSSTFGGIFGIIQIPFTVGVHYSWTPLAFFTLDKQDVTVDAGTYSAYHIQSLIGDYCDYYFAPVVGNIVKFNLTLTNGEIQGELTSTNYS
jgi:hypothetical protein